MRACLWGCLGLLSLGGAAFANDANFEPGLTGDWGGSRTALQNDGWQFQARGMFESAFNAAGGDRRAAAGAGELDFAALASLGSLIGDDDGSLEAKITDRFGAKLDTAAGLNTLMQVQEIWGRGDIWRLTQLSFAQSLFDKALNIEFGRINPGGDFDVFSCNFQNLNFCGPPPGAIDGTYWLDSPVGQWGARAMVNIGTAADAEIGIYQISSRNLNRGFSFDFSGNQGTLIPFKLEWKPALVFNLPGGYQIGGWYAAMNAPDVFYDVHLAPGAVTGAQALLDHGRSGFFLSARQQVTGSAPLKDAPVGTNGNGLSLFFNYTDSDRRTSTLDNQFALGAVYKGAISARPNDEIALAFGATHVNESVAAGEELRDATTLPPVPMQHTEYVTELDYRAFVAPGVELSPNVQVIADPGGVGTRGNVVILGLKTTLVL